MPEDEKVGYGKPPKSGQFKPGKSGNPKGRPKGAKSLKTDVREVLDETVPVKVGGKIKQIRRQRAIIEAHANKAIQGNVQSAARILDLSMRFEDDDASASEGRRLKDEDREILARAEERMARRHAIKKKRKEKGNV